MSFGQHEFQHRFYNKPPTKKSAIYTPSINYVLPITRQYHSPPPQRYPSSPYVAMSNDINLKVRAGTIKKSDPGWQGYRLKSFVTDKYSQNYRLDSQMLDKFKKEAKQYRKRKRFGSLYENNYSRMHQNNYQPNNLNDIAVRNASNLPEIRRHQTQPQEYRQHYNEIPNQLNNMQQIRENPQNSQVIKRYDVGIMTRMNQLKQQRQLVQSRIENMREKGILNQQKLNSYKLKYDRLKQKLKQEIIHKRFWEGQQRKQKYQQLSQRNQIDDLEHMMSDISVKLHKNSQLLNESLKIQQQIQINKSKSNTNSRLDPQVNQNFQANISNYPQFDILSPVVQSTELAASPIIVYTKKNIKSQYQQLAGLNRQIRQIAKINKRY